MKLTASAAAVLALEPGLTGMDFKVWLLLVDNKATAADLARIMEIAPSNAAASCRKLLRCGWITLAEEVGRSKLYTARETRNQKAPLPGQITYFF